MKTQDFDYYLPAELIAQFPAEQRASSRLLYLDSIHNHRQDTLFSNLPNYLRAGDVMVFNDTQVIKARLFGKKDSGGNVEVMVERVLDDRHVLAAIRASHAPKSNSKLLLAYAIPVTVITRESEFYTLRFEHEKPVGELLECYGQLPLPPYIARPATAADESRYQTVYARNSGAVAAPTAGLHFDTGMMDRLRAMGVIIVYVTLHIGAGTFQPVRVENIADHTMHSETFHIPQATVDAIEQAKSTGGRILSVGTTSLRALESCASLHRGQLVAGYGDTQIFITPGYRFQVVERLLTNFHLPCSTLLMLVSAFAGMNNIQCAYHHAVTARYRFFSYGDAMLIEKNL
ncbi:tRNA preQ1(34) S-adenosylmethionine ribosyltransferase-isomerase QueA [Nitrosomonas sp.]|uniref:tRNA preQ1(34) S-adenosylmethionine ribosyltransferase-isomerase QueA n=1 Tax=Nitrosomonas sp. TaxID=42353 RepID=UPI0025E2EFC1|nr:tRNA preQ1(34) S-adenosylmethionine ribosyltransferase-isomerase QueA [Nitrosomonas sp.]MBY0485451.1 tRNA preQ1(34) S-adenosylmethionine ribosyltransferase-isomerase QueA [Nitrosomonas sp.]